ncbi:MAG: hypothetical protein Kow009_05260 [Spirochaetales bacterium]
MKRVHRLIGLFLFLGFGLMASLGSLQAAPPWEVQVAEAIEGMAKNYFKPVLTMAFGTFTYEYTGLGSAFSRYLEEKLITSLQGSQRIKLFARHAVENMDPEFRQVYRDFFKTTDVDAVLYGRFSKESSGSVRLRLEMAGLTTGELLGSADITIPSSEIPSRIDLEPPGFARAMDEKQELENLLAASKGSLVVRAVTSRGAGAVYKNGEDLTIHVFVNQDAYLKVYHVDVNGKTQLIFPNQFYSNNKIKGGTMVTIPDAAYPFRFQLGPPYGAEFIKVVASTQQFADVEKAFSDLPGKAKEVMTRGLTVLQKSTGSSASEVAEALVSYTIVEK